MPPTLLLDNIRGKFKVYRNLIELGGGETLVRRINIVRYRKLENMTLDMSSGVNIISGTNGTCKTSLLHIISNAHQAVTRKCNWVNDKSCLGVIKQLNNTTNPKIESLTKGDKIHNDPANGTAGKLFSIDYFGHSSLEFRRHDSKTNNRYAVKPWYRRGTTEKLPFCPVIYLGLARLYPFGEYQNDAAVERLKKSLPAQYQTEIASIYRRLTGMTISSVSPQKMGDIKTRADFDSDKAGIDSNTISAGEDSLFIAITALVSLRYYFESITSNNEVESVLLIDELDATLHPSLQFKLLDIFREYSQEYKIQIVFTTHSLSILEYALKKRDNVIYLIDNVTSAVKMESPDIYKIRMYLYDSTRDDIYLSKAIPLFTEDNEARVFLNSLFDYYAGIHPEFAGVRGFFHLVDANIGAANLRSIFGDTYLLKTTMKSICILDGDQQGDLDKYTITLPGGDSPEKVIMDYAITLYDNDSEFWTADTILDLNYGKVHFRNNIRPDIDGIPARVQVRHAAGESAHGVERDLRKKAFKKHQRFFELLFRHWIRDSENSNSVTEFYGQLNIMFKKVAEFYGINPQLWTIA